MDKIWYRNPSNSEVIGRCGGDEKTMTTQNGQKSNANKKLKIYQSIQNQSINQSTDQTINK